MNSTEQAIPILELPEDIQEQIETAYAAMANQARYRPAAPSDGFGNITGRLNLTREATQYAADWWKQEDGWNFFIGTCDYETRPATIFAIEAARLMCSGVLGRTHALALLKMAVRSLESTMGKPKGKR